MKNGFFDAFFKYHAGSDDKLQVNLAWPYFYLKFPNLFYISISQSNIHDYCD